MYLNFPSGDLTLYRKFTNILLLNLEGPYKLKLKVLNILLKHGGY
jgi:hypothetical protein